MAKRAAPGIVPAFLAGFSLLLPEPADAAFRYVEATIADVHEALRSGELSCEQVVSGYLARIEAYDKPAGLNAIIFTNPAALERAREIDRRLGTGEALGPLHCIPVLLKDNFDTAWLKKYTGGWDGTNETKDYFERLTAEYVLTVTPLRLCRQWTLFDQVTGTDGTGPAGRCRRARPATTPTTRAPTTVAATYPRRRRSSPVVAARSAQGMCSTSS